MAQEGTTERACDRCRERRVKCDKRLPSCLRCEKLGKPCPGYDKKRKFVDEGVSLRKKYQSLNDQASSSSAATSPANATPSRPFGISPSSSSLPRTEIRQPNGPVNNPPSIVPPRIGSTLSINPTTQAMIIGHPQIHVTDASALLDDAWQNETYDPEWFDLEPEKYYSLAGNTCGFIPNIPNIVDEVDQSDVLIGNSASATPLSTGLGSTNLFSDSNLWAPDSQLQTSALISHERDHEIAYLVRHFTESLGPWMDLFDKDNHFTHLVPIKALRDALLRNAIAAVAAKQLGRVKGGKPFVGLQAQKPSGMEVLDDNIEVDWFYKAANYYDKAIAFSRQYLEAVTGGLSDPNTPNAQVANSDDLLVAISLFSLYESLDNLDSGWLQHLSGMKSLLVASSPSPQVQNQKAPSVTGGRLASFWNFARADYQAAYLNEQPTFLDTDDVGLWNSVGLEVQASGALYASTDYVCNDTSHSRETAELVAHTLIWLGLKVVNYRNRTSTDQNSAANQEQWDALTRQLDHWYGNLPATYQPCASIRHRMSGGARSPFTEVFYSMDMCAATLLIYHFARMNLLLHRPLGTRTGKFGGRLQAYREVSTEAIRHAHEIVGIALGRPQPATRVEMMLPLCLAGACLEADDERKVVLDLLEATEKDTGCNTQAQRDNLVQEWGWVREPQGVA